MHALRLQGKRAPARGRGETSPWTRSLALGMLLTLLFACLSGCASPFETPKEMVNMGGWGDDGSSGEIGGGGGPADSGKVSGEVPSIERISPSSLTLGGKKVYFGEDVTPLLAALGQWKQLTPYTDSASSGDSDISGSRKQYSYDGFSLLTYSEDGVDRLDAVIFTGESAVSGEGLHVGMSESLIGDYFGESEKAENGVYSFREGGVRLRLACTPGGNGKQTGQVECICYERDVESDRPLILLTDVTVEIGSAIPFREYIFLLDSLGAKIDLYDESRVQFDASKADPMTEGSYPLTVRVEDDAGKTAERSFAVYVVPKTITEETTAAYVRGILEGTLAERLQSAGTNEDKLRIVFQYLTKESGMQYVESSNKDNPYYVEAYNGFTTLHGDCYTYCCMSQVMLDALEIEYRVVTRNGERRSNHFWLLADFGDGWYHFDTCYHAFHWKKETFKLTDGEVAAFTTWYNTLAPGWNYYQFDHSLYPPTPTLTESGSYEYTPYTVTYTAGEGGSVIGEKSQQILHGEKGDFVTAQPEEGYVFRRWSDGLSTPTRVDSPKENITLTAEFVPAP